MLVKTSTRPGSFLKNKFETPSPSAMSFKQGLELKSCFFELTAHESRENTKNMSAAEDNVFGGGGGRPKDPVHGHIQKWSEEYEHNGTMKPRAWWKCNWCGLQKVWSNPGRVRNHLSVR